MVSPSSKLCLSHLLATDVAGKLTGNLRTLGAKTPWFSVGIFPYNQSDEKWESSQKNICLPWKISHLLSDDFNIYVYLLGMSHCYAWLPQARLQNSQQTSTKKPAVGGWKFVTFKPSPRTWPAQAFWPSKHMGGSIIMGVRRMDGL